MSLIPPFYEAWFTVQSFEADARAQAKPVTLANIMQEMAWRHAEAMGIGYSCFAPKKMAWILARFSMNVLAPPVWGQTIKARTWPSDRDRLYCYRDYCLENEAGETLALGTSAWFVLDLSEGGAKRPLRTENYYTEAIPEQFEPALPKPPKLRPMEGGEVAYSLQTGSRHLDVNQHVNNTRYVEWLVDALPHTFQEAYLLRHLDIVYCAESLPQQELEVRITPIPPIPEEETTLHFAHEIRRSQDGKELCRAQTTWKKR